MRKSTHYIISLPTGSTDGQSRGDSMTIFFCFHGSFNPLSPHDAIKHHFTSLKTYLIFLKLRVLDRKFPLNLFNTTWSFSLIFEPHQVIFIHYKSRIAAAIRGL